MKINNTTETYGLLSKAFHWSMALIMLGLIIVGFYMAPLPYSPDKAQLITWHKSFGLLILMLVGVRLLWRLKTTKPASLPSHKKWEKVLSKIAHFSLYGFMLALPLTGWVMSSAGGHPIKFFGLSVPPLVQPDKALGGLSNNLHEIFAYILVGVIFLHAVGAFKHHFIDKDKTVSRMASSATLIPISLVVLTSAFFVIVLYLLFGR